MMPSDGNFSFSVLIAGLPVPEYEKEGRVYIESNLWTPVSYQQQVRELVYGEVEEQQWPVTPYQIKIETCPDCPQSWYDILVDGTNVGSQVLQGGGKWTCKGFYDSEGDREFLFSLPRFAHDEGDRVAAERKSKIGTIEVVRKTVTLLGKEYRESSYTDTQFEQANKKDAVAITGGKHTMSTTKKGKIIRPRMPSERKGGMRNIYDVGPELGHLSVDYRMAHTLQGLGITLQQMKWSESSLCEVSSAAASSFTTSSSSSSTTASKKTAEKKGKSAKANANPAKTPKAETS